MAMNPNDFCINYKWGCMWGKVSSFSEVDEIAKSRETQVEFLGLYEDRDTNKRFLVFRTASINYLVDVTEMNSQIKEDKEGV